MTSRCEAWDVPATELAANGWNLAELRRGPLRWLRSRLGKTLAARGQIVALDSCATVRVGRYVPAKYLVEEPPAGAAPAYLRIADIHNGTVSKASSWILPSVPKGIRPAHLLQVADVLLSRSGTVDKAGVVPDTALPAIAGGGIFVLHIIDPNRLDPHFLVACLGSAETRAWLKDNSRRSVVDNLTKPLMNRMKIPLPPLSLQRKAATRFQQDGTDVFDFLMDEMQLQDSSPQTEST